MPASKLAQDQSLEAMCYQLLAKGLSKLVQTHTKTYPSRLQMIVSRLTMQNADDTFPRTAGPCMSFDYEVGCASELRVLI